MQGTYHDTPNLPLTHAASVALVREMMAKNPGATPFALWEQAHVEVARIFVPTGVAKDHWVDVVIGFFALTTSSGLWTLISGASSYLWRHPLLAASRNRTEPPNRKAGIARLSTSR